MDRRTAQERLERVLEVLKTEKRYDLQDGWLPDPELSELGTGDWIATSAARPGHGVVIKQSGEDLPFFGALGQMVPALGWRPASREYFLGSAFHGRYQVFEAGMAGWEAFQSGGNLGHPVAAWRSLEDRARSTDALVAFLDLRGFTNWSGSQEPRILQETIERFERCFQDAFHQRWCQKLFVKGTGDGLMIISEVGHYNGAGAQPTEGGLQSGHALAFCEACARTVSDARRVLPADLAVGCGITFGRVTQLFLLGRFDYLGQCVNEASKIQSVAYDEVCVSDAVVELLREDGRPLTSGKRIPKRGLRVSVEELMLNAPA